MSILSKLFGRKPNADATLQPILLGGGTTSSSWGGEVLYGSDIVVQSIRCKSTEFKKLQPRHIRRAQGETAVVYDSVQKILDEPNAYMTQSEFLEKITILLELNKNVYIYPMYKYDERGERSYTGLYPLNPSLVEMMEDKAGDLYYKFTFRTGTTSVLPIDEVIHWKKDYGIGDYFGGNGEQDAHNQYKSVKYYNALLQSIGRALDASCQINGILKVNSMLSDEKIALEREKFEAMLKSGQSGIMVTDFKSDYVDMKKDAKLVDSETIKFMYSNILRANGTPLAILSGDYTKSQKEAYYEHSLESDIKALGEVFTKRLFTEREKAFGNRVVFYPSAINFMSMENKLSFAQIAVPSGSLLKDEFREIFGLPPMPNGMGKTISQGYNTLIDVDDNEGDNDKKD